jgi:hypothetical protein
MTESFSPEEIYKQLVDLVQSPEEPKGIPFSERIPSPKCLKDRIAIVGAGPAGIHMAYLLKKKGFQNIVVLEKSKRVGGKTLTIIHRDTAHDLGACCTQPGYENVHALAQEFGVWEPANLPPLNIWLDQLSTPINYSSYVFPEAMKLAETNDPKVAAEKLFMSLLKYVRLHREYFGKYKGELMRKPTPRVMNLVNCTFLEFIEKNGLTMLKPIFIMSHTGQGFGHMDEISALYGLIWNTPHFLTEMAGGMFTGQSQFYTNKGGFQTVFETIQTYENIDVRFDVDISRIYRRNDKVLIKYSTSRDWAEFDFLIWTPSLSSTLHLIDPSEKEKELFSGLTTTWCTTTLFDSTYGNRGDSPIDFWFSTIEKKRDHGVWEQRDSYGTVNTHHGPEYQNGSLPGGPDGQYIRTGVAYQYGREKPDESSLDEIFRQHFTNLDAAEVKVIQKDIWEYFPRFSPQKMASGALWDIFDNQGSRRTWFVGSSVILESVKSVLEYNKLLVSKMTEGMSC